ncbi:uncharacterized protein TNCV_2505951 [Trichonephila clavipes]|uniref:Uncharacterized protein n=1 Tax=Trichonephila clavipes TaxID=2585209 RepID=A0A8X7BL15_TRICX|nr:uncharacterized protein TNCV_2505951 [Trichonephila clavipes]
MSANPYEVQVEKLECIVLIQKYMDVHLLNLKSETEKESCDGKCLSGRNRVTDILIAKIQIVYYSMAIKNNINDLHSMKTAVWAVYFPLLSSNESPQHGLCPTIINA